MLLVKINGVLDKNLTLYLLVDQICTYRVVEIVKFYPRV